MNKNLLDHTHVFSSSERRVVATAEIFSTAFLDDRTTAEQTLHQLTIRKDLLDDSNAAKSEMDKVKKRLKSFVRPGAAVAPEFAWPLANQDPFEVIKETIELMRYHRDMMKINWETMAVEKIQTRWCCGEYPYLFRERWEAHFNDWCNVELEKFDPSRVSELYDSLKYDALHKHVRSLRLSDPFSDVTFHSFLIVESLWRQYSTNQMTSVDRRQSTVGRLIGQIPIQLERLESYENFINGLRYCLISVNLICLRSIRRIVY
jgi:hypothetical protein